jgi:hypothetical protein
MPDDKTITGKGDGMRIDIHDPNELAYWTKALQVTPEDLKNAVSAVGPMVGDVCRKLHVRMDQSSGSAAH